jgi:hypothetical protein
MSSLEVGVVGIDVIVWRSSSWSSGRFVLGSMWSARRSTVTGDSPGSRRVGAHVEHDAR